MLFSKLEETFACLYQPVSYVGFYFFFFFFTGANVNAKDTLWLTPLHRAAASRNEVHTDLLALTCWCSPS